MGYSVYWIAYRNRWEGYGVPAVCDWPNCHVELDHGLAYRCEEHVAHEWDIDGEDEKIVYLEGCDLTLCEKHRYNDEESHFAITPKPNVPEWIAFLLSDDSWAQWRAENPEKVERYERCINGS